ncbi:MAG: DUF6785 family protein [Candidatus Latescibacterota bacterium]|nr:DUF6785 family protein [Candidatus Latescibacterota bacterium]
MNRALRFLGVLALTLGLSIFLNFVGVRSYILLGQYSGFADHFNTVGVIFLLFCLLLLMLPLRLLSPALSLSPSSMALVYAGLMTATVIPTMGFGGYFIPLIAGAIYYATPENYWRTLLWDMLPEWALPKDPELIRQLFEGVASDQPIPWGPWILPSLLWALFMLAFFSVSLATIGLVHHQWSREERLVYPLAVTPSLMVESLRDPASSFLRSKLLWFGFAIAFSLPTVRMLDRIFDIEIIESFAIPSYQIAIRQLGLIYNLNTDLLVVGLSFLINLNILFSVWFLQLIIAFEEALLGFLGIGSNLPAQPHVAGSVFMAHQQIGALLFISLSSLWISRDFLRRQWRLLVEGKPNPATHLLKPRTSALLGAAGLLYMTGFLYATGLTLAWSIAFLVVGLLIFFGTARVLAQTGISRLRAPYSIAPIFTNLFGTAHFGHQGLAALGFSYVWAGDLQLFHMGTLAHAFRVCEDERLGIGSRQLFTFLFAAVIVGLVTTIACYIYMGYRHGLLHGYGWYYIMSPQLHWGWVTNAMENPNEPQLACHLFLVLGAGLAALLSWATHHFVSWPLHPVGLAFALTNTVRIDWFGIFIAWLLKAAVLRYGGVALYRTIRPFFIGLILGACVGVGGASLLHSFYYI